MEEMLVCPACGTANPRRRPICWQLAAPSRWYPLFLNGEQRLSSENYALLTQQIAALIAERTGLPLYDFRTPQREKKEKKAGRAHSA